MEDFLLIFFSVLSGFISAVLINTLASRIVKKIYDFLYKRLGGEDKNKWLIEWLFPIVSLILILFLSTILIFYQSERTKEAINISLSNIPNSLKGIESKVDRLIEANGDIEDDSFQINE